MTARRPVLVTGASSGIGEAIAAMLAADGFRVWAGVRRALDGERLRATYGERVTPIELDVTDAAQIAAAAERIHGEDGLYGLVNNAGVLVAAPLEGLALEDLRAQFEVNVFGTLAVTQAMLPLLRASVGRVVNIGSISSRSPFPFTAPYGASKAALRLLNDGLRMELAPWEIGVTLIEPGGIRTPIWERTVAAGSERFDRFPSPLRERYEQRFTALAGVAQTMAQRGAAPRRVARAVRDALIAARPPELVTIGADARAQLALNVLPARVRDRLVARLLGAVAR